MKAINFPTICSSVNAEVRAENYKHLQGLELVDFDPNSNGDKTIDILIGADFYWEFVTGEVVQASNGPVAVSSKLGWLLSGPCPKSSTDDCALTTSSWLANVSIILECKPTVTTSSLKRF